MTRMLLSYVHAATGMPVHLAGVLTDCHVALCLGPGQQGRAAAIQNSVLAMRLLQGGISIQDSCQGMSDVLSKSSLCCGSLRMSILMLALAFNKPCLARKAVCAQLVAV